MARHHFGIMWTETLAEERFDSFEPERFDLITLHDDYIEPVLEDLNSMDCYWHSLSVPGKNLAYCGITLIPPKSLGQLRKVLESEDGTEEVCALLREAESKNKFVIHYGI